MFKKYLKENFDDPKTREYFLDENRLSKLVNHAKKHHKLLSSNGSSRIVFELDDKRVIKIAKNENGLEQNYTESSIYNDKIVDDILCPVLEEDDNEQPKWIIVRKATKCKVSDFKKYFNLTYQEFVVAVDYLCYITGQERSGWDLEEGKAIMEREEVQDDEYHVLHRIHDLLGSYDMAGGDLKKRSSWGIVDNELVLIDYGYTMDMAKRDYKKRQAKRKW